MGKEGAGSVRSLGDGHAPTPGSPKLVFCRRFRGMKDDLWFFVIVVLFYASAIVLDLFLRMPNLSSQAYA